MEKFEVVSFEQSQILMPQASNVIGHFRSLYFKDMPDE